MTMLKPVLLATLLAAAGLVAPAVGQDVVVGRVMLVFADPTDVVTELDQAGRCGSRYFHIQRAAQNFKEVSAVALTAFATDRPMIMFVASCAGDRNVLSHAAVGR